MKEYLNELAHIIGSAGTAIQHIGNILTITANKLTSDDEESAPQPEGSSAQVEHSHTFTTMPEMHANYRGTELEDDNGQYRIGFRMRNE